jgi:hypothetical protein
MTGPGSASAEALAAARRRDSARRRQRVWVRWTGWPAPAKNSA